LSDGYIHFEQYIALAAGTASEWKNGLAWVIIGGLLSSLILTVYLVPVVYEAMEKLSQKLRRKSSNAMDKKVV
jgi:hydrophobic/amphiphilic exporter-1 (mainly G- bacteria), HAE1 family